MLSATRGYLNFFLNICPFSTNFIHLFFILEIKVLISAIIPSVFLLEHYFIKKKNVKSCGERIFLF